MARNTKRFIILVDFELKLTNQSTTNFNYLDL